jgi:hypothetical protein
MTTHATIRRTNGNTSSNVGKATIQDSAQAVGQVARKPGVGPRLLSVDIIDTTNVMKMESTSGITTGA